MMQQWSGCKKQASDCLLLFRLGDFYEAFEEDAKELAHALDLTLTKRQDTPMSGIPAQTLEQQLDRLVALGYRVAVAEQLEEPKGGGTIVKRGVQRIVSPATHLTSESLPEKHHAYFAAIDGEGNQWALVLIEATTGEFFGVEASSLAELIDLSHNYSPKELLLSQSLYEKEEARFLALKKSYNPLILKEAAWRFQKEAATKALLRHYGCLTLAPFAIEEKKSILSASGALVYYLKERLLLSLPHLSSPKILRHQESLQIDSQTRQHLELIEPQKGGERGRTLLATIDETKTPMGGRLLRHLLLHPLISPQKIGERQSVADYFLSQPKLHAALRLTLESVIDFPRLMAKIAQRIPPTHIYERLLRGLTATRELHRLFSQDLPPHLQEILSTLHPLDELIAFLEKSINLDREYSSSTYCRGFHAEYDRLYDLGEDSNRHIEAYAERLREETGIRTLKIQENRAFGYYIEVSKGQKGNVPLHFEVKQTLVNGQRYTTIELQRLEREILIAKERIREIEALLAEEIRQRVLADVKVILANSERIALLDLLASFAETARRYSYVRPIVDEGDRIEIEEGRHPILERLNLGERFIPNDLLLEQKGVRLALLTGPNMGGKSTFIRQAALIVLLAQIGSFVPAKRAQIGSVDKLFTRIGASDDLARGFSTFMCEMVETATILSAATSRSFVILDEIGRGTSTYDGVAIAWAVAEALLQRGVKTLFATHYFELTSLEKELSGVENLRCIVEESGDELFFSRRIGKGAATKSYGIHVAKLAGLPLFTIQRAKELLGRFEERTETTSPVQERFSPLITPLMALDLNRITPLEAHRLLFDLQKQLAEVV